jgi:micrococcal nuclease
MRIQSKVLRVIVIILLALFFMPSTTHAAQSYSVKSIYDGDTLTLSNGNKVRLLQIDTPELSPAECYGKDARQALIKLIDQSKITLEGDKVSNDKDRYGRLLRYVYAGKINLNLKLVEIGAATPYFYQGEKGKYSSQLLKAAQNAQAKKIGLWKLCPKTKLEPSKSANTGATLTP